MSEKLSAEERPCCGRPMVEGRLESDLMRASGMERQTWYCLKCKRLAMVKVERGKHGRSRE